MRFRDLIKILSFIVSIPVYCIFYYLGFPYQTAKKGYWQGRGDANSY